MEVGTAALEIFCLMIPSLVDPFARLSPIQVLKKEETKTFMMVSNWKIPLVSMIYTKVCQRSKG